ncbi:protease Lon-related BREX system protein BrxL [Mycolicibacterium monacense]|uniref:protease Lon-related BREX system protein BrxL n=1 Tax=Mycolicibacterium monacense TaxID=85693 RepID=UPI0007EB5FE9|nr:protease Lon-related BREX system protein BrxL [Mycolicibacterium monacense]OBF48786.1 TIGR02688 family protein [Mycolicibacterium monacense]
MDQLDRMANDSYIGRVVRKDLVRRVKVGNNVPVHVLEFLLGKYAASDDPEVVENGLVVVNQTLIDNFIRPDESELAKSKVKLKGQHRLIDKVEVRLVENRFWATLANFNDKWVHIQEDVVQKYDRLVQGGVWCQLDLVFNELEDERPLRPFYIKAIKPIQVAAFDLEGFLSGRRTYTRDQWIDLIMRSIGLEPSEYDLRGKFLAVTRLIPMVERNYNLIELGPWGTGKSFVYREQSPNSILISGGKITVPQLFVNNSTGRVGLLGNWDVVAFDEVAALEMSDSTVIQMLKDYMESGSFARGREEIPAEASTVFVGNTSRPHTELVRTAHLFADLPKAMVDPAFLDRLHFYLPGWEAPKLEPRLFTDHYGFVSDYLSEAFRQLRKRTYVNAIDTEFTLGPHLAQRDVKAVRKTVSGLLKILHPHGEWTRAELREYLEWAMEGRRRVKEQLKKLASYDFARTSFSYIEIDTGREYAVEVPEQPEDELGEDSLAEAAAIDEAQVNELTKSSVSDLIAAGESATVEFKATARVNTFTGKRDSNIELAVIKTVAGFMNAHGGTLLIGVADDGTVLGVERDILDTNKKGRDGFENALTSIIESAIGRLASTQVRISFETLSRGEVCRLDVQPSTEPVFVRNSKGDADLYVRINNSTRLLNTADAIAYIRRRF